jgi:DNA-binding NtrC family response regulator
MRQATILLLDFAASGDHREMLQALLTSCGQVKFHPKEPIEAPYSGEFSRENLKAVIERCDPDLMLVHAGPLKQTDALFTAVREYSNGTPLVPILEESTEPNRAIDFLQRGAADYLTLPLKEVEALPRVWRLLESSQRGESVQRKLKEKIGLRQLVGESEAFRAAVDKIPVVARCDASILISGETGTGKELYARALHYLSRRSDKPFVPVNCGAIPTDLVENELFGHESGAFTGASAARRGLLHEAEGGTLFLDEIDCLPAMAQMKLLRFLQEKEFRPLGSTRTCCADVRVIAASNVDFQEAVRTGKMRKDLYYRLNVIFLTLPALRDRRDDIPLLVKHFIEKYAVEFGKPISSISPEALQALVVHDWPGNVRELEHAIERAVVLCEGKVIRSAGLDEASPEQGSREETFREAKASFVEQFEKGYIQKLLLAHAGNITRAAAAAQKNRRAFWQLIHKHKIDAGKFKVLRNEC